MIAWVMWGVPAVLFFIAFFHRVAPGVMARELMDEFRATGTLIGLLSATYFYSYAALMIPAGLLIDAFGVRYVVAAGGTIMGSGAVAMGLAASTPLLFAGRLAVGLGATVTFIGALKIAATWFAPSRFAFLSAVTATVGILGSVAATVPLAWAVALVGWRGALVAVGAVTLAGSALCFAVVRDRPRHAPADLGRALALRDVLRGTRAVLANRHTWPPFLVFFCLYASWGNLMLWIIPCLRDIYGLPTPSAAAYAMATPLALLVAAPLTGFVSDRVLRRRKLPYTLLTAGQLACWILLVGTLGVLPLRSVYAILFVLGVVGGAFVLTWPIGREVNPPHLAGVAVAVVNLGGFIGAAMTQGPLGAILDARWAGAMAGGARVYPLEAYRALFAVCGLFVLAAVLLSLLVRETRGENVYAEITAARGR
ncbi:MAG: MFS transporter [Candidatus Rokubacteria bacterium]|nr:MFS transporter [Candidatus Rokubacteria bacterium]